jgi:tetratricopeptide (TPR) repeat protein
MATALQFKGWSEFILAEYTSARDAFSMSRAGYLQVGNLPMAAYMSSLMTIAYQFLGDQERATLHLEEALTEFREITLENHVPWCLLLKSMIALERGRYDQVVEVSEEIGRIAQRMSDSWPLTVPLYLRAHLARLRGDAAAARRYAQEELNIGGELAEPKMWGLVELGHLALQDGDQLQARAYFLEGLQVIYCFWYLAWLCIPLDGLAVLAVREGHLEHAARLFGTRHWRGIAHTFSPIERAEREADFAAMKNALGEERFEELRAEGYAMTFQQTLELALDASSPLPPGAG